jgi:predicted HTH transcriptional regulator
LLIGVKDDGTVQGLENDFNLSNKVNKMDYFKNGFDRFLNKFFGFSVISLINSDFFEVDGKTIWVVQVEPSYRRPIFLINNENQKEFFVRGNASSRQLTDIEEIINY